MRQEDRVKNARPSEDEGDAGERRNKHRRTSGRKRRSAEGRGFEMPFQMGTFMQMLPLLMAMGGNMPGKRLAGMQLRIAMMMIEIWIDYLAAMQDFMEQTLKRLMDLGDGGFLFGEEDDDDADDDDAEW